MPAVRRSSGDWPVRTIPDRAPAATRIRVNPLYDGPALGRLLAVPRLLIDFCPAMLDVVEVQVQFVGVLRPPAELRAVVRQNRTHFQTVRRVERQHVIVHDRHRRFRLLGGVQKAERVTAVCVHHRM